ncbi:hypothetical protein BDM02DRAFT_3117345 [Thelephora ganbajun]|uniref:Uncharacterized protein n=1 Tax=Thelephora ganbajun TaxID=370292 RepID=A0ACB6ZC95_THEGA|nr:hypothetical protein BDM02DRAFT_3117345 [Thelephora ganbajun]
MTTAFLPMATPQTPEAGPICSPCAWDASKHVERRRKRLVLIRASMDLGASSPRTT